MAKNKAQKEQDLQNCQNILRAYLENLFSSKAPTKEKIDQAIADLTTDRSKTPEVATSPDILVINHPFLADRVLFRQKNAETPKRKTTKKTTK